MTDKNILHMVTPLKNMSPFDVNMAVDAGYDVVVPYTNVTIDEVTGLVQDAIFSRPPHAGVRQAMFFAGKSVPLALDMMEKAKAAIILTFASGKEAKLTVKSDKNSDVNLFIYDADKKVVAKDDSPGPDCEIKFTPKASGKYTVEVVNLGPGDNKSNLKVEFAKSKDKDK